METSNLLDSGFKTLVIKMLSELKGRVDEVSENFDSIKKDMKTIKKNESEMKDTLTEMKNNLLGVNSRGDEAENQINDLGEKKRKKSPNQNRKKPIKNENSERSLWDNFKQANICIIGVIEGDKREQEIENIFRNDRKLPSSKIKESSMFYFFAVWA